MKLVLLTLLLSAPAFAEGPCAADREKFCKDVKGGMREVIECLKKHEAELSAECKSHGAKAKEQAKEVKNACKGDAEKLCPGTKGHARIKCMLSKMDQASEACRKEAREAQGMLKGL